MTPSSLRCSPIPKATSSVSLGDLQREQVCDKRVEATCLATVPTPIRRSVTFAAGRISLTKPSRRAIELALRGAELLAQKSECARHTGHRRGQVPTESNPVVGHVGSLATVRFDELVCVGDGEILLTYAVVQVQRGRRRVLTEPVRLECGAQ